LDAQRCYFCLPNHFHIYLLQSTHRFEPDLMRNMFRTSFCFATPSLKHDTASHTPSLSVSSLTKQFRISLSKRQSHVFIRIVSFPMKTLLQRIYTSKIPRHWFNCIHSSSW
jgi:hypothetical protein